MSFGRIAGSFLLLCFAFANGAIAQGGALVRTTDGSLVGVQAGSVTAFKGIPYAAPPVRELRWREPQPVAGWSGSRRANAFGNACMQKPGLSAENGGDPGRLAEDCLYLNVWTPRASPTAKLPVIVWIHGGAYVFGSGSLPIYDGSAMARKGAVFVSMNYRLGPLGFFAHPALNKGASEVHYNFGLLDQVAALKWVKQNIGQFGGDANNVTLMGQSAGGKSVLWHFASPLSRGLFHKGIAQSVYILPDASLEKAREVAIKIASATGLDGADASIESLRKVEPEAFFEIADKGAAIGPVGIVGDAMLPRSIADTFRAGDEARLSLIIGNTSDDSSVIAAFGVSPSDIMKKIGALGFGLKLLYPRVPIETLPQQALRDIVFTMNSRWVADRHAKQASTWRYYFDYVAAKDKPKWKDGTPHGGEIVYFLDTVDRRYSKRDRDYARNVSNHMIAFARSGNPATSSRYWQDDRAFRDRTMIFGPEKIEQRSNFMKVRLDVLMGATKVVETLFSK
jgi:para-nitrobenzyl esterase